MQKTRSRWAAVALAFAAASIVFVACGSDDGDDGGRTTTSTRPAASATARSSATQASGSPGAATPGVTQGAAASDVKVVARDFKFEPAKLEATVGKTFNLTLENAGSSPHTLTVYEDSDFKNAHSVNIQAVAGGQSETSPATFEEAKTYFFRCELHPDQMKGEIVVTE